MSLLGNIMQISDIRINVLTYIANPILNKIVFRILPVSDTADFPF